MCFVYLIAIFIGMRFGLFGVIGAVLLVHFIFGQNKVPNILNSQQKSAREAIFLETLFSLMGALAKVDGVISQAEINHAENVISNMQMSSAHREAAIQYFRKGASKDFNIDMQVAKFNQVCANATSLKRLLLGHLINTAMADGGIGQAEAEMLRTIGVGLGFMSSILDILFSQAGHQYHYSNNSSYQQQQSSGYAKNDLAQAYAALGLNQDCSNAQLKRSYRKLMSENHPDKLMGQGMPPDMIELATQKAQQIQSAYDLIKKSRDLS